MTQEDKDLLLKDLCARLPYGVKCHFKYGSAEDDITLGCIDKNVARFEYGWYGRFHVSIDANYIKPYLRPMSSITEEEISDLQKINWQFNFSKFDNFAYVGAADDGFCSVEDMDNILNYLYKHHLDYHGLIEKGLAIEAPEGMYK